MSKLARVVAEYSGRFFGGGGGSCGILQITSGAQNELYKVNSGF